MRMCSFASRPDAVLPLLLFALVVPFSTADAAGARLHWLAPSGQPIAGYHVYVRPAGAPYGVPIDAGLPSPNTDGAIPFDVDGLAGEQTYYFAVASYTAEGYESLLSQELSLGAVEPCVVDRCLSRGVCDFGTADDGTMCNRLDVCGEPGACHDPCATAGVCQSGMCQPCARGTLDTKRVAVRDRRTGTALTVKAMLDPNGPVDPRSSGVAVAFANLDGVLHRMAVPGTSIAANRKETGFKLLKSRESTHEIDRLRMRLRRKGDISVSVKATAGALDTALDTSLLGWGVQVGDVCASTLDLDCQSRLESLSCR
jgi:hypothetical protein